jgi:hypothetical protein
MCGIAGHSCWTDYDKRLDIVMPILALYMENRGRKSWGWTNGEQIVKDLGEISEGFNPSFTGYRQSALHTRHPTTGSLSKSNSHPFHIGNVIGMHNGVVRNHEQLQKKYNRTCSVDSEHIFHHIADGLDTEEIIAYGAIVFWQEGKLYLGRFNGGELTLCKTEAGWVFASTKSAISKALSLAGLTKGTEFYSLDEDKLYSIGEDTLYFERKLKFGEYNTQTMGTWENTYNGYTNNYGFFDWDSPGSWVEVLGADNKTVKTKIWKPDTAASSNSSQTTVNGFVNRNSNQSRSTGNVEVMPAIPEKDLQLTPQDRIMRLIENAAKAIDHEHKGESWPCSSCKVKLFDKMPYFITDDEIPQILCETCGNIDKDSCINEEPLLQLPDEIGLVSAFFYNTNTDDAKITCEGCNEVLEGDEFFVATKDHEYCCVQCFCMAYEQETEQEYTEFETMPNGEVTDSETAYAIRSAEKLMELEDITQDDDGGAFARQHLS